MIRVLKGRGIFSATTEDNASGKLRIYGRHLMMRFFDIKKTEYKNTLLCLCDRCTVGCLGTNGLMFRLG